jgi:hypothetical protein
VRIAVVLLAACASGPSLEPSAPRPLPAAQTVAIDTTPKERRRMMPPEIYLRAYMTWFGGLLPLDVQTKARGRNMFDAWDDYLAALGLPDYRSDLPRASQSNTLMAATLGRLGEALCVRAVEHDLRGKVRADQRVVFAFEPKASPSDAEITERIDVLHRTFLGYPLALAPPDRTTRMLGLYKQIATHHAGRKAPLTADETAWAAVCSALVQHPETELY